MRSAFNTLPSTDGMGISGFQNENFANTAKEVWAEGYRSVRLGGTSNRFENIDFASNPPPPADILAYKAQGHYVEKGITWVKIPAFNFPALSESLYQSELLPYIRQHVPYYRTAGVDAYMLLNEMVGHIDNTTLTIQQMYTHIVEMCNEFAISYPGQQFVYNGTANEMATWTTWIAANGPIPTNLKLGFNLYGSGQTDVGGFKGQLDAVKALNGYISEWSLYYDWSLVTSDQDLQLQYMKIRKKLINDSGLKNYYFVWKFQNTSVPNSWSDFSVKYSNGVPSQPTNSWGTRKFFYALTGKRTPMLDTTKKSLKLPGAFSGVASYMTFPQTISPNGISLAFWLNRLAFYQEAKFICAISGPHSNYLNGFRLYSDQWDGATPQHNLILNTGSNVAINEFNAVSSTVWGAEMHIAITIVPGAGNGLLYINGLKVGNAINGNMGTPADPLTFGGRPVIHDECPGINIRDLVIHNGLTTPWTPQQINDHMKKRKIPTIGSSFYDFSISDHLDQSSNGNDLTISGGSIYSELEVGGRRG